MTTIRNRARVLRKNMTDAELRLWSRLRRRQVNGFRFRRQFPLGRYVVDFICLEVRLIVELDGGQHAENVESDRKRDEWLHAQNFKVLRFWNGQVLQETDADLEAIMVALNSTPPPQPSPARGEGEFVKGAGENCRCRSSPVRRDGDPGTDPRLVPPPLEGGGEGEG